MTTDVTLQPAGVAMDQAIATRVMGATLITATPDAPVSWDGEPETTGVWLLTLPRWEKPDGPHVRPIPHYSAFLESAWAIVAAMSARGYSFGLWETIPISSVLRAPAAGFQRGVHPPDLFAERNAAPCYWADGWTDGDPPLQGDRGQAALAICRAALRCLERENAPM